MKHHNSFFYFFHAILVEMQSGDAALLQLLLLVLLLLLLLPCREGFGVGVFVNAVTEHPGDVRLCAFGDFELREGKEEEVGKGGTEISTIDVKMA